MKEQKKIKSNKELLIDVRVKTTDKIKEEPVALQVLEGVKQISIMTLGNFSAIIGKAKSKKTFLLTLILGTMAGTGVLQKKLRNLITKKVILFDTEQSNYHLQKVVKRIVALAESETRFEAYALRRFSPAKRLELIEDKIKNTKDLGMIAIDGVRDLVNNINSEEEATSIVTKLMEWTYDYNIHIVNVIHMNKADLSARGHIGTEIQNKSESVISVEREEDFDTTNVEHKFSRGMPFKDFSFSVQADLPEVNLTEHEKETDLPF